MCNFKIGEKIVCVKETISKSIKLNEIYTVKDLFDNGTGVVLFEVDAATGYYGFHSHYFRKMDYNFADEVLSSIKEQVKSEELCHT